MGKQPASPQRARENVEQIDVELCKEDDRKDILVDLLLSRKDPIFRWDNSFA